MRYLHFSAYRNRIFQQYIKIISNQKKIYFTDIKNSFQHGVHTERVDAIVKSLS